MRRHEFTIDTAGREVIDITGEVIAFCRGAGEGLLNVFLPHATAGLAIIETGAGSEEDLAAAVARLLPRGDRYVHRHGSRGHGADHLLPAFVAPSLVLPVAAGRPQLGTWQHIVVVDPNQDNRVRRVLLSLLPG